MQYLASVSAAEVLRLGLHHIMERNGDEAHIFLLETILIAERNHLGVRVWISGKARSGKQLET